ncbi:protein-disulfide reductase DsbD family protein [Brevundimonas sp.]|uniref:protein-disulfide reductase DsbD family protein n=1 Tax=Brevundimonas sp. TaxID=1871086 RepID=UPI003D1315BF
MILSPMLRLLALFAALLLSASPALAQTPGVSRAPAVAQSGPQRTVRIEAELVVMSQWAAPGSTAIVAVRQQIEPGWHTYWRNPGDSGGATALDWTLPPGVAAGDIVWPLPSRQRLQGLVNFGYEGVVFLPVPIEVPADARPGTTLPLTVRALFLVCSDEMCVPDELTLRLDLPIRAGAAPLDARFGRAIQTVVETAPRPAGIEATAGLSNGRLIVTATGGPLVGADLSRATFFPFDPAIIDHGDPLAAEAGPRGLTLTLQATGGVLSRGLAEPVAGVLATDAGAWEIRAIPGAPLAGAAGGERLSTAEAPVSPGFDWLTVGRAALFALIGGLILNLMPCVFPVLAMKAASLASSAHDPAEARRDGFAFLAGVLTTFILLAGVLLILRAGGQAIGWGFQLQSPGVVAGLALLMLAIGLNLSGVFEIGLKLQSVGGASVARRSGPAGAFATGVLAVVVAAPCTAPFMAAALGAALLMPAVAALLIFVLLGLGLALPYLLISLSPGLLARFPRPGPWMERLRGALAFPMYGAALWLAWVFARQQGLDALGLLFVGGLSGALGLWLFGRRQTVRAEGRGGVIASVLSGIALVIAVAMGGLAMIQAPEPADAADGSRLASIPWSAEAVTAAQAEGRPVFVDFTADWCVSCKLNERTALASPRTAEAIRKTNAVVMVADWTLRDDAIARELERHGRSGVPLYLVYAPGEARPSILPQLLTDGVVVEALEKAAS